MPTAMYSSGATIFPVCPTCQSFGTKPASTAAREAPIAERRNARREVLSEGIRRSEDVCIAAGKAYDEGREILGERVPVMRCVRHEELLDARDRGGGFRCPAAARAGDENGDIAADLGR